jgi:hypothetical protein
MSKLWVTEPMRIRATDLMFAASGVETLKVWLWASTPGAFVIVGRAPLNR